MFNKTFKNQAVLLSALIALSFSSCPTEPEEEPSETWSPVTELSQIDGTWKGNASQTKSLVEFLESQDETVTDETQALGGINVSTDIDLTMIVGAAAKTSALNGTVTTVFSGGNIGIIWLLLIKSFNDIPGAVIDNSAHSVTMPVDQPETTMSDDETAEFIKDLQINQTGNKVKASSIEEAFDEIIFIKQ